MKYYWKKMSRGVRKWWKLRGETLLSKTPLGISENKIFLVSRVRKLRKDWLFEDFFVEVCRIIVIIRLSLVMRKYIPIRHMKRRKRCYCLAQIIRATRIKVVSTLYKMVLDGIWHSFLYAPLSSGIAFRIEFNKN